MKLALAMIVKGVDEEAIALNRCLEDFAEYFDGVFITVTHEKGQEPSQLVYDVCNKYKAITSKFEWVKDFAAARNYNFSQVPKEFTHIFWCDADDGVKHPELLKSTIEAHLDVDVFSMFYLYAFDEHKNATVVHQKTRIVKNDGCVVWAGNGIHEDFKENRELIRFAIKGIEVVHLSDDERMAQSRERNYDIAKDWITKHPDARSYWNLGNSAFGVGKYAEALSALGTFMETSKSDEEKYIARIRRAEVLWAQGKLELGLDEARYALGMKPEYPDAYHLAGKLYYQMGQYEKAKDMFLNGLTRPAPYYQILVYNPRDYDYTPLMNLAKAYYALNLPQLALPAMEAAVKIVPADKALKKTIAILKKESKEGEEIIELASKLRKIKNKVKLKKELDNVPEKFRFHPEILRLRNTNFIKEESSGKDMVIFCGYTAEEWTPASIAKTGSGGSEEAITTVSAGFAKKGWNVIVYNNCGTEESIHEGVTYRPYMSWNYRDKQDVTILWRQTKPLDWEINSTKVFVDMHDVIPVGEFTPDRIERATGIFFKSKYHRNLFKNIPDAKAYVIPNGIHPEEFPVIDKDDMLMINTASPVRALSALIDIMKEVRKEVPKAKMQWAYGWSVTDKGMEIAGETEYPNWKSEIIKGMKEAGIEDIGRLTYKEVANLYNKASLYLYPTGFPEIDCISITKALAAGSFPITTDYAAVGEKAGHGGDFIHWPFTDKEFDWYDMAVNKEEVKQEFVKQIIQRLKNPPSTEGRKTMREWATKHFAWENIISRWEEILN